MSQLSCKNIGCRQSFKWRQQLKRHKVKCSYPAIENKEKYIQKGDDSFQCTSSKKLFSKQSNTSRHIKTCKGGIVEMQSKIVIVVVHVKNHLLTKTYLTDT